MDAASVRTSNLLSLLSHYEPMMVRIWYLCGIQQPTGRLVLHGRSVPLFWWFKKTAHLSMSRIYIKMF